MKVVTFVTKAGGAFKYLEQSLDRLSTPAGAHELVRVGWGCKWRGFGDRLIQYRKKLMEIAAKNPDEVCLVIDGYDVLLTGDMGELERQYRARADRRVVFSTEKPKGLEKVTNMYCIGPPISVVPGAPYVYICAGAYIGYADSIVAMLDKVVLTGECDHRESDDQHLLTKLARRSPADYAYDVDWNWFVTWGGNDNGSIGLATTLHNDGTVTYAETGKAALPARKTFVLHRQFARNMENLIRALGYEMTAEDVRAVARDPYYVRKFHIHHAKHKWMLFSVFFKVALAVLLLSIFAYAIRRDLLQRRLPTFRP